MESPSTLLLVNSWPGCRVTDHPPSTWISTYPAYWPAPTLHPDVAWRRDDLVRQCRAALAVTTVKYAPLMPNRNQLMRGWLTDNQLTAEVVAGFGAAEYWKRALLARTRTCPARCDVASSVVSSAIA